MDVTSPPGVPASRPRSWHSRHAELLFDVGVVCGRRHAQARVSCPPTDLPSASTVARDRLFEAVGVACDVEPHIAHADAVAVERVHVDELDTAAHECADGGHTEGPRQPECAGWAGITERPLLRGRVVETHGEHCETTLRTCRRR